MADFNTSIIVKGTHEEFKAIIAFLEKFSADSLAQYKEKRDCYYVEGIIIFAPGDRPNAKFLEYASEEEIKQYIDSTGDTICIDLTGPYGRFGLMDEIDLFERLAEAFPNIRFTGNISGFNAGGDHAMKAELEGVLLHLSYFFPVMNGMMKKISKRKTTEPSTNGTKKRPTIPWRRGI